MGGELYFFAGHFEGRRTILRGPPSICLSDARRNLNFEAHPRARAARTPPLMVLNYWVSKKQGRDVREHILILGRPIDPTSYPVAHPQPGPHPDPGPDPSTGPDTQTTRRPRLSQLYLNVLRPTLGCPFALSAVFLGQRQQQALLISVILFTLSDLRI